MTFCGFFMSGFLEYPEIDLGLVGVRNGKQGAPTPRLLESQNVFRSGIRSSSLCRAPCVPRDMRLWVLPPQLDTGKRDPLLSAPVPNVPRLSRARQVCVRKRHQSKLCRVGEMPLLVSPSLLDFAREKVLHEIRPLPDECRKRHFFAENCCG